MLILQDLVMLASSSQGMSRIISFIYDFVCLFVSVCLRFKKKNDVGSPLAHNIQIEMGMAFDCRTLPVHVMVGLWLYAVMENTSSTLRWRCVTRASARRRSSSGHTTLPSMLFERVPPPFRSLRTSRNRSRSNQILVPKVSTGIYIETGLNYVENPSGSWE